MKDGKPVLRNPKTIFGRLLKHEYLPWYHLHIDGKGFYLSPDELTKFSRFRRICKLSLNVSLTPVKQNEWSKVMDSAMKKAAIVKRLKNETETEASNFVALVLERLTDL